MLEQETQPNVTEDAINNLSVLTEKCKFTGDLARGTVVITSSDKNFANAIETLGTAPARRLALIYAASRGLPDPRINGMASAPYAVNCEGNSLDQVDSKLPRDHKLKQPAEYRVNVPVIKKMV